MRWAFCYVSFHTPLNKVKYRMPQMCPPFRVNPSMIWAVGYGAQGAYIRGPAGADQSTSEASAVWIFISTLGYSVRGNGIALSQPIRVFSLRLSSFTRGSPIWRSSRSLGRFSIRATARHRSLLGRPAASTLPVMASAASVLRFCR